MTPDAQAVILITNIPDSEAGRSSVAAVKVIASQ